MMEAYPGMPVNHYSKLIGEKWRTMTEEQKQVYYQKAEENKK